MAGELSDDRDWTYLKDWKVFSPKGVLLVELYRATREDAQRKAAGYANVFGEPVRVAQISE